MRGRCVVRAELLVGEFDLDGLIGTLELNFRCHRLVSRACARGLIGFVHTNDQPTDGGVSPTASLRLRDRLFPLLSSFGPCPPCFGGSSNFSPSFRAHLPLTIVLLSPGSARWSCLQS